MSTTRTNRRIAALSAAVLLLCSSVLFASAAAYAADGGPDHVLTYTPGDLVWDEQTDVRADGTAWMDLFGETYQNVVSSNGERVFAPGTEMTSVARLENESDERIRYIAVMYRMKAESTLPVAPELLGDGFADVSEYPLPEGVQNDQVVRAVTGTVEAGATQDFEIAWEWNYYESDRRDEIDTSLGDKAAYFEADEVTAGLYIVVEVDSSDPDEPDGPDDPNDQDDSEEPEGPGDSGGSSGSDGADDSGDSDGKSYIRPHLPQTGDDYGITILVLSAASALSLLIVLVAKRREAKKCDRP